MVLYYWNLGSELKTKQTQHTLKTLTSVTLGYNVLLSQRRNACRSRDGYQTPETPSLTRHCLVVCRFFALRLMALSLAIIYTYIYIDIWTMANERLGPNNIENTKLKSASDPPQHMASVVMRNTFHTREENQTQRGEKSRQRDKELYRPLYRVQRRQMRWRIKTLRGRKGGGWAITCPHLISESRGGGGLADATHDGKVGVGCCARVAGGFSSFSTFFVLLFFFSLHTGDDTQGGSSS